MMRMTAVPPRLPQRVLPTPARQEKAPECPTIHDLGSKLGYGVADRTACKQKAECVHMVHLHDRFPHEHAGKHGRH